MNANETFTEPPARLRKSTTSLFLDKLVDGLDSWRLTKEQGHNKDAILITFMRREIREFCELHGLELPRHMRSKIDGRKGE